jgi:hypothetical protein
MSRRADEMNGAGAASRLSTGRLDATRQLLHPRQIRDSMALARPPGLRNSALAGLQAAFTVAIALPLVHLSPWPHLIGYASLGSLVALFGRGAPQGSRLRILAYSALLQTGAVFVMSCAAWLGLSQGALLAVLALCCGVFAFLMTMAPFGPPGALIFAFAAGAAMGPVADFSVVLERSAATAVVSALACAICALTEMLRRPAAPAPTPATDLSRNLKLRLLASSRLAIGAAAAAFACQAVGAPHPAWAALGAVAVMQGAHLHLTLHRTLQRMAGTVVGAVLVWLVLTQQLSVWTVIALLIALQFATEVVIGSNYALGQIFVTPMALLMSHLAAPHGNSLAMPSERVLDTLVGVVIGLGFAILFSTFDDREHLARHHAERTAR